MDTTKIKLVLFTSKTYSDSTHPVLLRITKNRKVKYISTGVSVVKDQWDDNTGLLKTTGQKTPVNNIHPSAKRLNALLLQKLNETYMASQKLSAVDDNVTPEKIKNIVVTKTDKDKNFLEYGQKYYSQLESLGKFGTSKRYKHVLFVLSTFLKVNSLGFEKINVEFLNSYHIHLTKKKYHTNTIHNHLKTIRALVYRAISEGRFPQEKNPFFQFKLSTAKTQKLKLTLDEIKKIEAASLDEQSLLWHCRNYFLFSFYNAGIRAGDLIQLRWKNISEGRLKYQMGKSGSFKSIQLHEKSKSILDQYRKFDSQPSDYIFPLLNSIDSEVNSKTLYNLVSSKNALINKYLKLLATKAEISKPLSLHISRHSFADIARKRGANTYDISKALAHSSIKVTESYLASIDEESLDKTMSEVMDF